MNHAVIDSLRHEANAKLDPSKKGALGQFMTPFKIAEFMASLFVRRHGAILLDAGAGIGSLTLAASQVLTLVRAEAWELDPVMVSYLRTSLAGLGIPTELHEQDFILDSVDRIQFDLGTRFTHAILNPPYKKSAPTLSIARPAARSGWRLSTSIRPFSRSPSCRCCRAVKLSSSSPGRSATGRTTNHFER